MDNDLVSVIMPSNKERYLQRTIEDVFAKASGPIEIIVTLDGYWPEPPIPDRTNLHLIHWSDVRGMRPAINAAAALAKGKYILKCDAHCMFAQGFDEVLKADCDSNWVVVPRRRSLDVEKWDIIPKSPVDYHYLCYPYREGHDVGMHGEVWKERARARADILIDDEMSSQGSCWFMHREYFDRFGGESLEGYGNFVQEFQQIGNRTWLSGGRVVVNKKTWYAHWHKGPNVGRGYFIDKRQMIRGTKWSADYWMGNKMPNRIHDLDWLIDKFSPVPTWPDNWKGEQ